MQAIHLCVNATRIDSQPFGLFLAASHGLRSALPCRHFATASVTPSPSPAAPRLSAIDLACRRGTRLLFQHLAFDLAPGQLAWVRGHNGRGKTSLLRLAAGLSSPEHGQILYDGKPARRLHEEHGLPLFIAHANALKDDLTASESLQFLLRLHGRPWRDATIQSALQRLGLLGRRDAPVRTLSQGQRRRVALARLAVEEEPSLWILDEPFDALDAGGVALLNQLLAGHLARSGNVLLTSHLPLDADLLRPMHIELDAFA